MANITVSRTALFPDRLRISRYKKSPELGPKILFFSGGSALNHFSQLLKEYTHNSIHLITPFDSGGSSAKLRQAFDMPAVGDLRNRLIALADSSVLGHASVKRLFSYRFPLNGKQIELKQQLKEMTLGQDSLFEAIPAKIRKVIQTQLKHFYQAMPDHFDLSGASIGNLVITGGYLNNNKNLDPALNQFCKLTNVLGVVRLIVADDLHLAGQLDNGEHVLGQHLFTGKEVSPIQSAIKSISLTDNLFNFTPAQAKLDNKNRKLIEEADLIVYPPGSFYSSLIANLLPNGVNKAIANNLNSKVFIPNLGKDPELVGMTLESMLTTLLNKLQLGQPQLKTKQLINFLLIDSERGKYPGGVPKKQLQKWGITLIDTRLIRAPQTEKYDNDLLVAALLSLT